MFPRKTCEKIQIPSLQENILTQNWEDVVRQTRQMTQQEIVDQQQINILSQLIQPYPQINSHIIYILQDICSILTKNIKQIVKNRQDFLLSCFNLIIQFSHSLHELYNQKLKPLKALISLFILSQSLLNEVKDFEKNLPEQKLTQLEATFKAVFRFLFMGVQRYQNQLFPHLNDFACSSSSSGVSSSSDAESEPMNNKLHFKIRSQSILLLQIMVRQLPKTTLNCWQLFIKPQAVSQQFIANAISSTVIENNGLMVNDFSEPSLLSLLIQDFGSSDKKLKIMILQTLIILFDHLNIGKWIIGHDFEKYEKQLSLKKLTQKQAFQPKAYQLYNAAKNTHFSLIYLLGILIKPQQFPDCSLVGMVMKVYYVLLNSTQIFEKIQQDLTIQPLITYYLSSIIQNKFIWSDESKLNQEQLHQLINLKICSTQVLSSISKVESQIFKQLLIDEHPTIQQNCISIMELYQSNCNDNIAILFLTETFNLFGGLQKLYQQIIFQHEEQWLQFYQINNTNDHRINHLWLRVIEEMLSNLPETHNQKNTDDMDDENNNKQQQRNTVQKYQDNQPFLDQNYIQHTVIPQILQKSLISIHPEILTSALNILTYLPNTFWKNQKDKWFIDQLTIINQKIFQEINPISTSQMKINFYRTIGSLTYNENLLEENQFFIFFQQYFMISVEKQNIHILEKMSWALANLFSNLRNIKQIDRTVLINIFDLLLYLASSAKEKLATNGLRGLGHFLRKLGEIDLDRQRYFKKVLDCYEQQMKNKNQKIVWNASYSLNNTLIGNWMDISLYFISSSQFLNSISQMIQNRESLKILIHAYEVMITIQNIQVEIDKVWEIDILIQTLKLLSELGQMQTFLEQRYLFRLRWQCYQLLESILKKQTSSTQCYQGKEPFDICMLYHDNEILQSLIEEAYELILQFGKQCPQNSILWVRADLTRDQILEEPQDGEIPQFQKHEETQTNSSVRYLRIDLKGNITEDLFSRALQSVQTISKLVLHMINESALEMQVNFSLIQSIEDLTLLHQSNGIVLIKLQIA